MHEEWEFRNLPREEKSWKRLEKSQGRGLEWKRECLGDEQAQTDLERSKKWEMDHEERIYRLSVNPPCLQNFVKSIIGLHLLLISSMLTKFLEN